MIEKRTIERYDLELEAAVTAAGRQTPGGAVRMTTRDVSSDGAFLFTADPLPVGTGVNLEMTLMVGVSGGRNRRTASIRVSGNVLRAERDGMAVVFHRKGKIQPISDPGR